MENKNMNNPQLLREAMRIASTPEGKQLMSLLQQKGGEELQSAIAKAASGDLASAKDAIMALMNHPDTKKLLDQLGR